MLVAKMSEFATVEPCCNGSYMFVGKCVYVEADFRILSNTFSGVIELFVLLKCKQAAVKFAEAT
jgi:hypothetical protein